MSGPCQVYVFKPGINMNKTNAEQTTILSNPFISKMNVYSVETCQDVSNFALSHGIWNRLQRLYMDVGNDFRYHGSEQNWIPPTVSTAENTNLLKVQSKPAFLKRQLTGFSDLQIGKFGIKMLFEGAIKTKISDLQVWNLSLKHLLCESTWVAFDGYFSLSKHKGDDQ